MNKDPSVALAAALRPRVEEISAKVRIPRAAAEKMFPQLRFLDHEKHVILTEILRPASPGGPVAVIHEASGQKFVVDHYELDGARL